MLCPRCKHDLRAFQIDWKSMTQSRDKNKKAKCALPYALAIFILLSGSSDRAAAQEPAKKTIGAADAHSWLWKHKVWSFKGRFVVLAGPHRGSGRFHWDQVDHRQYLMDLNAPVTGKHWELFGNTHYDAGTLTGLDSGPMDGEIASSLLQEQT